jgi:hypothetical protein
MEASINIKNYYSIMGITKNSTLEEIKKAFRDNAKKYHPDVSVLPDAHQRFIEIAEAYEVLKDSNTRKEYDALLDEATKSKQNTYKNSGSYGSAQSDTYNDFKNTQQHAKAKAESYAKMTLEDLITGVLGFAYELSRTVLVGERDKPDITFGDYIRLGFYGILITICIIISFTGVGAIPGIIIARGAFQGMKKNGRFIGIGPLLLSTLIADTIVVILLLSMMKSIFE